MTRGFATTRPVLVLCKASHVTIVRHVRSCLLTPPRPTRRPALTQEITWLWATRLHDAPLPNVRVWGPVQIFPAPRYDWDIEEKVMERAGARGIACPTMRDV